MLPLNIIVAFALIQSSDRCDQSLEKVATVDWYNANSARFIETNDSTDHTDDYQFALSFAPVGNPRVLDVGCAQGRDIEGFLKLGVQSVVGIEPAQELAEHAAARNNVVVVNKKLEDVQLNEDIQSGSIDLIWAMASLLHVPEQEQVSSLTKLAAMLSDDGVIVATYKVGNGNRLERRGDHTLLYFDTTDEAFRRIVDRIPSLRIEATNVQEDYNRPGLFWIRVVLKKV